MSERSDRQCYETVTISTSIQVHVVVSEMTYCESSETLNHHTAKAHVRISHVFKNGTDNSLMLNEETDSVSLTITCYTLYYHYYYYYYYYCYCCCCCCLHNDGRLPDG